MAVVSSLASVDVVTTSTRTVDDVLERGGDARLAVPESACAYFDGEDRRWDGAPADGASSSAPAPDALGAA